MYLKLLNISALLVREFPNKILKSSAPEQHIQLANPGDTLVRPSK